MIHQGRTRRRAAQVGRSQLAVRLGLATYAALSTLIALRTLVLLLGFPASVWTMETILLISSPVVFPLTFLPAADRMIVGSATLSDMTAALLFMVMPLPFLSRRARSS